MLRLLDSLALVRLLRRGSSRFNLEVAALVVLAGLANAGVLAIINAAAQTASNEGENGRMLLLFLIAIALYVYSQRFILSMSITEVEIILDRIRVQVADRLRRTDLEALEHMGREEIFGVVARDTQSVSQAATTLAQAVQSAMMVIFSLGYLAILSKTAFVITACMTGLGIMLHIRRIKVLAGMLDEAQRKENEFLSLLTDLIDGFKEVRLRKTRSDDLYCRMRDVSNTVQQVKTVTGREFSSHFIFAQVMFYGLLGAIVFLLPRIGAEYSTVVVKLTAAILFLLGPLSSIVSAIPVWSAANVAAGNIFDLEARLEASSAADRNGDEALPPATVSRIEMERVTFQYPDRGTGSVFRLEPFDLEIKANEILFLVGGNGSGKSTMLKVLTGLYHPQSGTISLDGILVSSENAAWFRSHFAAVFSEYHLFDRLYGLRDVPAERVNELLRLMRISDKTAYENGRFTSLDLSQGQRKRLALLVALLEDRPILVLDEWAADQDPPFRRFFYEELLPRFKQQGKTIIAVTHDDKYFGRADRVVKMEYGGLVPAEPT